MSSVSDLEIPAMPKIGARNRPKRGFVRTAFWTALTVGSLYAIDKLDLFTQFENAGKYVAGGMRNAAVSVYRAAEDAVTTDPGEALQSALGTLAEYKGKGEMDKYQGDLRAFVGKVNSEYLAAGAEAQTGLEGVASNDISGYNPDALVGLVGKIAQDTRLDQRQVTQCILNLVGGLSEQNYNALVSEMAKRTGIKVDPERVGQEGFEQLKSYVLRTCTPEQQEELVFAYVGGSGNPDAVCMELNERYMSTPAKAKQGLKWVRQGLGEIGEEIGIGQN